MEGDIQEAVAERVPSQHNLETCRVEQAGMQGISGVGKRLQGLRTHLACLAGRALWRVYCAVLSC